MKLFLAFNKSIKFTAINHLSFFLRSDNKQHKFKIGGRKRNYFIISNKPHDQAFQVCCLGTKCHKSNKFKNDTGKGEDKGSLPHLNGQ